MPISSTTTVRLKLEQIQLVDVFDPIRVWVVALRSETGFDVAQAFAIGELGESHRQILVPAREILRVPIATITGNALLKFLVRQVLDQLRKHRAAGVHPAFLPLPFMMNNSEGFEV